MKILYLRPVFWLNVKAGGSVGHTAGVINAFSKNHELDVVSNDVLAGVNHPVQLVRPLHLRWLPLNINELLYNFKLLKHFRKSPPTGYDFIYQRYSGSSFIGYALSQRYSIPLVLEFNSSDVWKLKNWQKSNKGIKMLLLDLYDRLFQIPVTTLIEKKNTRIAFLIVVVSKVLRDLLVKEGVDPIKILVNPNGVDPDKFSPSVSATEIRNELHLNGFLTFGFIGTFGQWHGVVELAKAIVAFYENNSEFLKKTKFVLIGDGLLMPNVKALIQNAGLQENVIFTGIVPQHKSHQYLAACDVYLSPHIPNPDGSKFFGSPTKLFEYMAMEKPIIASALDQIGEIVEHNENAYLVTPGNIQELTQAITFMASHSEEVKRLGKNARKHVVDNYTWDKHVEKIIDKFRELKK